VYGRRHCHQIAPIGHRLMEGIFGRRDETRQQAEEATGRRRKPRGDQSRRRRAVADFDLRYGSLVVQAMPAGVPTLRNSGFVTPWSSTRMGHPRPAWRFLVPYPNAVAILVREEGLDQPGTERLVASAREVVAARACRLTADDQRYAGGVRRSWAHRAREIPMLGASALILIIGSYMLVPWTRRRRRLVPLVSTLGATVLTLSLFGCWRSSVVGGGRLPAILIGIGSDFPAYIVHGVPRRRVLVAAVASAAGFASLGLSPLPFVRDSAWHWGSVCSGRRHRVPAP